MLVTGFNRPDMLLALLNYLTKTERRIYVSLDKPEKNDEKNISDSAKCVELVKSTNFSFSGIRIPLEHEGCFPGVSNAIDWAFEYEDSLIIIEDDIVVGETFLFTMDLLLEEFRDHEQIGSIVGTNLVPKIHLSNPSHPLRLSDYTSSWGWATWKQSWIHFNQDLRTFPRGLDQSALKSKSSATQKYWEKIFTEASTGKIDSWAYRWLYSNLLRNKKTLIPNANLVLNRGFGEGATHTNDTFLPWWLPREIENIEIESNFAGVQFDKNADEWMENFHFRTSRFQELRARLYLKFPILLKIRIYTSRIGKSNEQN